MEILETKKIPNDCGGDYFLVRLSDGSKKEIPADALGSEPTEKEILVYLQKSA